MVVVTDIESAPCDRLSRARALHWLLAGALALACVASLQVGATDVTLSAMLAKLAQGEALSQTSTQR